MQGGTLTQELIKRCCDKNSFTLEDVKKIMIVTMTVLNYLHENNIAHYDLKPG